MRKTKAWVTIDKNAVVLYSKHARTREQRSSSPSNFRLCHGTKQTNRLNTDNGQFFLTSPRAAQVHAGISVPTPALHCVSVIMCSITSMQCNMHVIACM